MAFERIKGIPGKIYVPDVPGPKKHNCKDCFFCQQCSDERCAMCLNKNNTCCKKKISK